MMATRIYCLINVEKIQEIAIFFLISDTIISTGDRKGKYFIGMINVVVVRLITGRILFPSADIDGAG